MNIIDVDTIIENIKMLTEKEQEIIEYFINKSIKTLEKNEIENDDLNEFIEELTIYYIYSWERESGIKIENIGDIKTEYGNIKKSFRLKYFLNKYEISLENDSDNGGVFGW